MVILSIKMETQLVHKLIFLGSMALFMNLGKLCANDVSHKISYSKISTLTIHSFTTKNVINSIPLAVESDLEYDDSQIMQHNLASSDNIIQSLDLLFCYNNYLSPKIMRYHYLLHFPVKRYLLNCIFLI